MSGGVNLYLEGQRPKIAGYFNYRLLRGIVASSLEHGFPGTFRGRGFKGFAFAFEHNVRVLSLVPRPV